MYVQLVSVPNHDCRLYIIIENNGQEPGWCRQELRRIGVEGGGAVYFVCMYASHIDRAVSVYM